MLICQANRGITINISIGSQNVLSIVIKKLFLMFKANLWAKIN